MKNIDENATEVALDPGSSPTLETRNLTVRFASHVVVNDVSLAFRPGAFTAIVGPNGAGKTTFFNLVSGQIRPTGGEVWLHGENVTGLSAFRRSRLGIARSFQITNLFAGLTVLENLAISIRAQRTGLPDIVSLADRQPEVTDRAYNYLEFVGLADRASDLASDLSHGGQRRLEVGIILAMERSVLLFDEPTAGMSVDEMPVILKLLDRIRQDHSKTILLIEHKMDVIRALADRIIVLADGRLAADGTPQAVMRMDLVRQIYLGQDPSYA